MSKISYEIITHQDDVSTLHKVKVTIPPFVSAPPDEDLETVLARLTANKVLGLSQGKHEVHTRLANSADAEPLSSCDFAERAIRPLEAAIAFRDAIENASDELSGALDQAFQAGWLVCEMIFREHQLRNVEVGVERRSAPRRDMNNKKVQLKEYSLKTYSAMSEIIKKKNTSVWRAAELALIDSGIDKPTKKEIDAARHRFGSVKAYIEARKIVGDLR